jgi:polar amino acid transport system substrate-binding protein
MFLRQGLATIGVVCALAGMCGVASAQTSQCEPAKVAEKYPGIAGKTFKIGIDPQSPPYSTRDPNDFNKVTGLDVDLAKAALDCVGAKYEFFIGGWSGLLPALLAGQIDIFWNNLYYTPERGKQVNYVMYMKAGPGAMTKVGNPLKLASMADLCGKTAAFGLGAVEEPMVQKQSKECTDAGKPAIKTMTYPDLASGTRLIAEGRADVMMHDQALVTGIAKSRPKDFTVAFTTLSGFNIGVAVAKKDTDLLQAIYDGMKIVQDNGTQKAIFDKYDVSQGLFLPTSIIK